jgi:poly(3-hydroxybutyrate) depolymerase
MHCILAAILAFGLCLFAQPANRRAPEVRTLNVAGISRTYLLAQPVQRLQAIAVVLVFHASGGSGERAARMTRLHTAPYFRSALVVYPDGLEQGWNHASDVAFVSQLIDDLLRSDKALDRTRIYAAGINNGGSFAMRLGCELNAKIAAIASIGGPLLNKHESTCKPVDPVPLVYFAAAGGAADASALTAEETFRFWRSANQCGTDPPAIEEKIGETAAKAAIARKCKEASEVRWVQAQGTLQQGWQSDTAKEAAAFLSRFRRTPRF